MLVLRLLLLCFLLSFVCGGSLLPGRDVCGKQVKQSLYGEEKTQIGEFPWLALIKSKTGGFICCGSLINYRYVITAAHCMDKDVFSVRLGEHNLATREDCEKDGLGITYCSAEAVDVKIEIKIVHHGFDIQKSVNDIALLRLERDVPYSDFIKPICLPIFSEQHVTYTGTNAFIAGWGQSGKMWFSNVKLKIKVPVWQNRKCSAAYSVYKVFIRNTHVCAGGVKGKSTCFGDSGGPLMYLDKKHNEENWTCIGLVSFALKKCALKNIPTVYTRVTEYVSWIIRNMEL